MARERCVGRVLRGLWAIGLITKVPNLYPQLALLASRGTMLESWRTKHSPTPGPSKPRQEHLCWGLTSSLSPVSPVCLVLWMTALALGCVAGSGPHSGPPGGGTEAVEGHHHIPLNHGGKRHHSVPIAIHRPPAALLRAGHSKYPFYSDHLGYI